MCSGNLRGVWLGGGVVEGRGLPMARRLSLLGRGQKLR